MPAPASSSRTKTQRPRGRLASALAIATLVVVALIRFREAVLTFYFLDDFWVMRDAALIRLESLGDVAQFFRTSHAGFALYRPLTTVAYAYLLHALFGYDASGYHAFQLLVFALNVVLVFAITQRLTHSTAGAFAVGLIYALAPGQAVNAYWLSAFTVTGTAVWLLLLMWAWLASSSVVRAVVCTALQVLGLLASEHALIGPVLLMTLAIARREPWRRSAPALAPVCVVVAAYLGAKLWYFTYVGPASGAYAVGFEPVRLAQQLGQYFAACFNVLTVRHFGESAFLNLAIGLVALLLFAAWRAVRGGSEWRLVAAGLVVFTASLGPVIVLRTHYFDHYVCLAAFGAALAVLGCCRAMTRHGNALAIALAAALFAYDLWTGERAWRHNQVFRLVLAHSEYSAGWVAAVQKATREGRQIEEVFVPRHPVTKDVFFVGMVHTYFPGLPPKTTLYEHSQRQAAGEGRAVLSGADRLPRNARQPGEDPRFDWLRRLAAWPEPQRAT